jgi:hypothetical protein
MIPTTFKRLSSKVLETAGLLFALATLLVRWRQWLA